ncbi:MAG: glycosyl hydrolase, partial [Gloeobacteraceae cyanobacterium ES-bin-144]|nr:glycosyl hydrolase [Verrucomicrobiales bacterium]
SNDGIKHFSRKATDRKTFDLTADEAKRAICQQHGEVKHIAQVRLNRRDLGIVWTDPWSVVLTDAVKSGSNELEISVVNTWVNRLIGDAALPKEKRITMTNIALQSGKRTIQDYQGFASEDPLMRSGLLGPVRLEFQP